MEKTINYTIGVDYGTDSVRALLVNANTGKEEASAVFEYPRWKKGLYCDAQKNQFRQHPLDYIEGLEFTVCEVLRKCPEATAYVKAISIDTTGSTPVAVNELGVPLSLTPAFEENPNAMFILWKDHTAIAEADEINQLCSSWGGVDYTNYSGGIYSSEWYWAKIVRTIRVDPSVEKAAHSWVEHCDWLPAMLIGNTNPKTLKRSRCAAGHKALWHQEWGGFPSSEFLSKLDPGLVAVKNSLSSETHTANEFVGNLSQEWASRFGLSQSVLIGVGSFDAHIGAVGGEIKPYYLSKVIGTSTCDMLVVPSGEVKGQLIRGICGQVDGSIIPNLEGMEAGQSAFGDIYAWFKNLLMWPIENIYSSTDTMNEVERLKFIDSYSSKIISRLSEEAQKIPVAESGIVALDWMNGRRTPDADQTLRGAIMGLNLGSDAPRIFRALVEATAFGSKAIVDRFLSEGVRVDGVIALGGVAKKSPFIMQILADVLNMPIEVVASEQTCALGAAMYAAVVAGIYPTITEAQAAMGQGMEKTYLPNTENAQKYANLFTQYQKFGKFIENK